GLQLCQADGVAFWRREGETQIKVAHAGSAPTVPVGATLPLEPGSPLVAAMLERRTIHIPDLPGETNPRWQAWRERTLARATRQSYLCVPLVEEGKAVGAILAFRHRPGGFSASQIRLIETFARQAVIAMANTRLFQELQERNRELS